MAQQFGFWTDLHGVNAVQLADGEDMVSTFMAMPYGEYEHPMYGKLKLTLEKAQRMAANVANRVRGIDLDVDYDHKAQDGKAAGWIQAADARDSGLFLTVKWTKTAWNAIKAGEYKYFSPEYHDEWKHPQTGDVHKDVLFGGGITNRPFLKDILPLNMSELFSEQKQEANGMDREKLLKLLGLPEDATDEQINTALEERTSAEPEPEQGVEAGTEALEVAASELPPEVIQLAEKDPAVKALTDLVSNLQQQVSTTSAALHLSESANRVTRLSERTEDGRMLSAGAQKQLQEIFLHAPKELSDKVVAFVEGVNKGTAYVPTGETEGIATRLSGDGQDSTKKFNDAVEKMMSSTNGMDYGSAVERVAAEQPDLFEGYRQQSYAWRETN
jgi:phage I-like protein